MTTSVTIASDGDLLLQLNVKSMVLILNKEAADVVVISAANIEIFS